MKQLKLNNPGGGDFEFSINREELGYLILSCRADNQHDIVKNKQIKQLIFDLVKQKIENQSLILTPNIMRFLALRLRKSDQSLIVKFGNMIIATKNQDRLFYRVIKTTLLEVIGTLATAIPYAIFMRLLYFDVTQNFVYQCAEHFQSVPQQEIIKLVGPTTSKHLAVTDKKDENQVEISTRLRSESQSILINSKKEKILTVKKQYTRSRKKAKKVTFSEFRKKILNYPVSII